VNVFLTGRMRKAWLAVIAVLTVHASVNATLLQDRGIFLAGPFETPDIHQPPGASAEAVFLAGPVSRAPLFLNELVVASNGSNCTFSNNGWVDGSFFTANIAQNGRMVRISWDLSGTSYALTYISVNFDNNFYHVYHGAKPLFQSEGQITVTGNLRDVISHIHFFGVSTVPDAGGTAAMLVAGLCSLFIVRHYQRRRLNS
jgi:hypothetical protein